MNNRGQSSIEKVIILNFTQNDSPCNIDQDDQSAKGSINIIMNNQIRLFIYEHVRYVLNTDTEQFVRLRNLDESSSVNDILHAKNNGVNSSKREVL